MSSKGKKGKKGKARQYSSSVIPRETTGIMDMSYLPMSQEEMPLLSPEETPVKEPEKKKKREEKKSEILEEEQLGSMPAPYYQPDMVFPRFFKGQRIYVGDWRNAVDDHILEVLEIGAIVACGEEFKTYKQRTKECKVLILDWKQDREIDDLEGDIKKILAIADEVTSGRPNILFFCQFGHDRAPLAAMTLIMADKNCDPMMAWSLIRRDHPEAKHVSLTHLHQLTQLYKNKHP